MSGNLGSRPCLDFLGELLPPFSLTFPHLSYGDKDAAWETSEGHWRVRQESGFEGMLSTGSPGALHLQGIRTPSWQFQTLPGPLVPEAQGAKPEDGKSNNTRPVCLRHGSPLGVFPTEIALGQGG